MEYKGLERIEIWEIKGWTEENKKYIKPEMYEILTNYPEVSKRSIMKEPDLLKSINYFMDNPENKWKRPNGISYLSINRNKTYFDNINSIARYKGNRLELNTNVFETFIYPEEIINIVQSIKNVKLSEKTKRIWFSLACGHSLEVPTNPIIKSPFCKDIFKFAQYFYIIHILNKDLKEFNKGKKIKIGKFGKKQILTIIEFLRKEDLNYAYIAFERLLNQVTSPWGCFDIETTVEKESYMKPFSCAYKTINSKNIKLFNEDNCIEKMVENIFSIQWPIQNKIKIRELFNKHLLELLNNDIDRNIILLIDELFNRYYYENSNSINLTLFAHNAGAFDSLIIMEKLHKKYNIKKIISKNNKILSMDIININDKKYITILDSYKHLPNSLDKLTKSFGLSYNKGYFPYTFIDCLEKIKYIGEKPSIEYFLKDNVDYESSIGIKTYKETLNYHNTIPINNYSVYSYSIEYLKTDINILYEILLIYQTDTLVNEYLLIP